MRAGSRRPDDALVLFRHRTETLVDELLDALSLIGLRDVDVALRVGRDAVRAEELSRLAPAVAEAREQLQRLPLDHVHLLVASVGEIQILLLRVLRDPEVPHGSVGERAFRDELLLDELAVGRDHLDAIVDAIASRCSRPTASSSRSSSSRNARSPTDPCGTSR